MTLFSQGFQIQDISAQYFFYHSINVKIFNDSMTYIFLLPLVLQRPFFFYIIIEYFKYFLKIKSFKNK